MRQVRLRLKVGQSRALIEVATKANVRRTRATKLVGRVAREGDGDGKCEQEGCNDFVGGQLTSEPRLHRSSYCH